MENEINVKQIVVELSFNKIQESVLLAVDNMLKGTYGNPIKDCVEKAFKEKENEISMVIKKVISDTMTKPEFVTKLGEVVMQQMVISAMKK